MATRSRFLAGLLAFVTIGAASALISSETLNPSAPKAISDLRDAIVKGLGFQAEGLTVSGFDVRDALVGQSVAYEFDIEVDNKVFPVKLLEDVSRWDVVDLPIFRTEEGNEEKGLAERLRGPDAKISPVLSPFQLAGPMELWIQDGNDMRLALPDKSKRWGCLILVHVVWHIWKDRNLECFEGKRETLSWVVSTIKQEVNACYKVWTNARPCVQDSSGYGTATAIWKAPELGFLKLNVDGNFVPEISQGSAGFLLRDHLGEVLLSGWDIYPASSPLDAEIQAAWRGVRALGSKFKDYTLIVEGDSAVTISSLQSGGNGNPLLCDCLALLRVFRGFRLQHIPRLANSAADTLARWGLYHGKAALFFEAHPCVEGQTRIDCPDLFSSRP